MPRAAQAPLCGSDVEGWTLGRFCDEIGARFAGLPALVASEHTDACARLHRLTYAELTQRAHALQWGLTDAGLEPGARVGVWLSSLVEWVLYLFAVTRAGAIFLPINTRFRSRELHHVLSHSSSRVLVAMGRYLGRDYSEDVAAVRRELPQLTTLIRIGDAPLAGALTTAQLIERGEALLARNGPPPGTDDPDAVALLFYTSGTTSFPKGVPLTHANVLPHSVCAGKLLELQPGEKVLNCYPFFGISGGINKVLSTLGAGAALVFQDAFRAQEACDLLASENCRVMHGVDVHVREMIAMQKARAADAPDRGHAPPPARRGTIAFTSGVDAALAREMGAVLGLTRFSHPYGMTETNPMILRNALDDPFEACVRPGGRIAPGVEVRVVDPQTGAECPVEVEGEIVARGPTVMRGYYDDPEANAAAFRDGWFHTGDLGVRTTEGFVFYAGRLKDMLKVGGFNVAPQEVESVLRAQPGVRDAAVTAAPDPRLGEVPVAFVQCEPDARLAAEDLIAACRAALANFKVPRAVHFVDALPYHTAAHGAKLQRHVLREWAQERAGAVE